jgi:hypothetical protein
VPRIAPVWVSFGGHVGRGAEDRARLGELAVALDAPRQPEVGDVCLALLVEQDVGRLQVAVEDAAHVRMMHCFGRRRHQARRGAGVVAILPQPAGQAAAGDQLHAEVALPLVLAHLVDRDDVRVVERGDRLSLVLEPPQLVLAGELGGADHLEGDGAVETDLPRLVHQAHAAAAELARQLVVAEVANAGALGQRPRIRPIDGGGAVRVVGVGLGGLGPSGLPRERGLPLGDEGVDERGLLEEACAVLLRLGPFAAAAAQLQLQGQQPAQQRRPLRLRDLGQVVLDPRPLPTPPGGLEAIARADHTLRRRQRPALPARRPSFAAAVRAADAHVEAAQAEGGRPPLTGILA